MSYMNDLTFWRSSTLGLAALGQGLFVVLYATFPWWKTFLGRALFIKALFLFSILLFATFSRTLAFQDAQKIFIIFYSLMAVGVWAQFFAFLHVKRMALVSRNGSRNG